MPKKQKEQIAGQNDTIRIVVDHDLVGEKVFDLEKRFLSEMASAGDRNVVLDLTRVKQINSPGIALCVGLFKECRARNLAFVLEAAPELYRFFAMFKLNKVIDIKEVAAK
jgi:anti-anti-sigma factor